MKDSNSPNRRPWWQNPAIMVPSIAGILAAVLGSLVPVLLVGGGDSGSTPPPGLTTDQLVEILTQSRDTDAAPTPTVQPTSPASTPVPTPSPTPSFQEEGNTYPAFVVTNYMDSCISTASFGLSFQQADQYCRCTITDIQEQYTLEEYLGMEQQAALTGVLPPQLQSIFVQCAS